MMTEKVAALTTKDSAVCKLCKAEAELMNSHIAPAFIYDWIKKTSATGYLRSGLNNNRLQDGFKLKLLCKKCESIFSKSEQRFASKLFYPFVQKGMDFKGNPTMAFESIDYDDWLLRFVVSVQWRSLLLLEQKSSFEGKWYSSLVFEAKETWRQFLNGNRDDTGPWENHLLFLYNPESITNIPPSRLPDNINSYLLRSVDFELAGTQRQVSQLTKMGPIALWTYLKPEYSKHMLASRIRRRGKIALKQEVGDQNLIKFLLLGRPKEVAGAIIVNDSVDRRVEKSFKKNPEQAINSMTYQIYKSDLDISLKKK